MTIHVVVADDNELLRAGLVTVLSSDPGITVVGEASSGPDAVRLVTDHHPDVVVMDVEMPGGDGITATRQVLSLRPGTRVLILTMFDLDEYVVEALRVGASGYVLKTTEPADLIAAVRSCHDGLSTFAGSVVDRVLRPPLAARATVPGLADLTEREAEVLRSMSKGLSNLEIGAELYLAETTVKTHVARILAKLGVRDRTQAVVLAHRAGLAPP